MANIVYTEPLPALSALLVINALKNTCNLNNVILVTMLSLVQ